MMNRARNSELIIDDRARGIFRVHRSAFVSPEILALERERVFDRSWLYVGHESEVRERGDFKSREVGGRPLIMWRGDDGEVRVLINSCTHRGAQFCREREGNAQRMQCFYHAWTFNCRGELAGVPDPAGYGPEFRREELGLRQPARVTNYRGLVFASFDPGVAEFTDYLAGAKQYLDLILDQSEAGMEIVSGTQQYCMRANWKLLVENSIDGYHAFPTHKTYFEYQEESGADMSLRPVGGWGYALGFGHAVMEHTGPYGRPVALWEPRWGEKARSEVDRIRRHLVERFGEERTHHIADLNHNLLIYPNLIINDIMSLTMRTFYPVEPGYLQVTAWALAPREESPSWRAYRLDNFLTFLGPGGFATPDDVAALESCQAGFRALREVGWSDISRGMKRVPEAIDEEQMRAFWRRWHEQMSGTAEAGSKIAQRAATKLQPSA
jgi:p-cumate 2,3-dioxygenase subunit alpha